MYSLGSSESEASCYTADSTHVAVLLTVCVCVCAPQVIVHRIGPGMVQQIQRPCSFCRGQGEMIAGKGAGKDRCDVVFIHVG